MLQRLTPTLNTPITFSDHTLIWIESGHGLIEVDFKTYSDFEGKLIFLSPGQYVNFLFGEFNVLSIKIPAVHVQKSPDYRVLFKHLVALGHIEFSESDQQILNALFEGTFRSLLDISTHQWFWQNPFGAEREEYTILFDLKDVIDQHFRDNISVEAFAAGISHEYYQVRKLVKSRLGLTIKGLAQNKVLLESQKEIAFSDKPIQEVAYDLGFKDPAYFNRFFKQKTRHTPLEFRTHFGGPACDTFLQDLLFLIREHHREQHSSSFYAGKTNVSIQTLYRRVKERLNLTVSELIRNEVIKSARTMLPHLPVREVAYQLGFREASHFSAYFKKYTGIAPSDFQAEPGDKRRGFADVADPGGLQRH